MRADLAVVCLAAGACGLLMFTSPDNLTGLLLGLALLFAGRAAIRRFTPPSAQSFLLTIFTAALLIREAGAIAYYVIGVPGHLWDPDAMAGFRLSRRVYEAWTSPGTPGISLRALEDVSGTIANFGYMGGVLFYLLGQANHFSLAQISCVAGALVPIAVYSLGRGLFPETALRWAAGLTAFFPSFIIWSCQSLKEPIVLLAEMAWLIGLVRFRRQSTLISLLAVTGGLVTLYYMRRYVFYCTAALTFWSLPIAVPVLRPARTPVVVAAAMLALMVLMARPGVFTQMFIRFVVPQLETAQIFRREVATGRSGTGSGVMLARDVSDPRQALATLPLSLLYSLLAPFPHHLLATGSIRMLLSLPELMVWWFLIPFALVGMRDALRERREEFEPMLAYVVTLALVYALIFGNIGLAYRHRTQIAPYFFLFAATTLARRRSLQWASRRWQVTPA